jgi:TetR/AcrR family transcriptional regulator, transcriptional repressor for nem operon
VFVSRGRPRTVSVADATEAGMHAFWRGGYHATPVSKLAAETGMRPGAMYQTFGDKQGILLAALARYRELGVERVRTLLPGQPSAIEGIRQYLLDQVEMSQAADGDGRGCLACNSALELLPGDPAVAEAIGGVFSDLHGCIAGAVAAGQRQGEIDDRLPAGDIATALLALVEGMFVLGRVCGDAGRMRAVVELTIDSLRAAPGPGAV